MRLLSATALLLLPCALLLGAGSVRAEETCRTDGGGQRICTAGILSANVAHVAAIQQQSQWCWAASISMIFRFHGYDIPQREIVRATYGSLVNMPAMTGATMSGNLNKVWTSTDGRQFESESEAFDLQSYEFNVNNAEIVDELRNDRPLLIGTQGHAMMLTAVTYYPSPLGPIIVGAVVRDPWPGRGRRQLSVAELRPTYIAKVSVKPVSAQGARPEPAAAPASGSAEDVLKQLLAASRGGFNSVKGRFDGVIDGTRNWDATVSMASGRPCTVWDRDSESGARVSCPIYRDRDESRAEQDYRAMVELVKATAPSGWTFSEQTSGQSVLMTNFRARGNGTASIRVNWSRFRTGSNNVTVWVETPR